MECVYIKQLQELDVRVHKLENSLDELIKILKEEKHGKEKGSQEN